MDESLSRWKADVQYLRVLRLAAWTMEEDVENALREILAAGEVPTFEAVEEMVAPRKPEVPEIDVPEVEIESYDDLLEGDTDEVAA